ncbi:MAG: hypothetical protein U9N01_04560 [Euryarchaeota archaeon]|nr:hypothetical protein [Euryarchaeota archaeon]
MITRPNANVERGAYSVIAYLDGETYVAEDNVGTTIKEGLVAATVLQAGADFLPTAGGKLFLSNDVFELNTGLIVTQQAVTIEGENAGVRFYDYGTMLKSTVNSIDMLTMSDRGANITNLCINGNGKTGVNGLKITNDSVADKIMVKDCLGYGLKFTGNCSRITNSLIAGCKTGVETAAADCWISNCNIADDDGLPSYDMDYGVKILNGGTRILDGTHIWHAKEAAITVKSDCVIANCFIDGYHKKGIVFDASAAGINFVMIDNNFFLINNQAAANTYDAIDVTGANSAWDARITNCTFYKTSGSTPRHCIHGSMHRLICTECNFHDSAFTTNALGITGAGNIIADNIGHP